MKSMMDYKIKSGGLRGDRECIVLERSHLDTILTFSAILVATLGTLFLFGRALTSPSAVFVALSISLVWVGCLGLIWLGIQRPRRMVFDNGRGVLWIEEHGLKAHIPYDDIDRFVWEEREIHSSEGKDIQFVTSMRLADGTVWDISSLSSEKPSVALFGELRERVDFSVTPVLPGDADEDVFSQDSDGESIAVSAPVRAADWMRYVFGAGVAWGSYVSIMYFSRLSHEPPGKWLDVACTLVILVIFYQIIKHFFSAFGATYKFVLSPTRLLLSREKNKKNEVLHEIPWEGLVHVQADVLSRELTFHMSPKAQWELTKKEKALRQADAFMAKVNPHFKEGMVVDALEKKSVLLHGYAAKELLWLQRRILAYQSETTGSSNSELQEG